MPIPLGAVVELTFTLENSDEIFDGAPPESPLRLKFGESKLSPAIEQILLKQEVGADFDVWLDENLAFGPRNEDLKFDVARVKLPENLKNIEVGMYFDTLGPDKKLHRFRVIAANQQRVSIDGNHPLAGQALRLRGRIIRVFE